MESLIFHIDKQDGKWIECSLGSELQIIIKEWCSDCNSNIDYKLTWENDFKRNPILKTDCPLNYHMLQVYKACLEGAFFCYKLGY